jgi:alkaline phosphatase
MRWIGCFIPTNLHIIFILNKLQKLIISKNNSDLCTIHNVNFMKKLILALFCLLAFLLVKNSHSIIPHSNIKKPKNIFLFIGDGMGYNQTKACDLYFDEIQAYEKWGDQFWVSTFPFGSSYNTDSAWTYFNYVKSRYTDSAPAATAMATGVKTYDDVIGLDHLYLKIETVCELAKKFNKSTGVISNVPIPHATPASFLTHVVNRSYYHTILSQMLIESKADVIIGCGNPEWDNDGNKSKNPSDRYIYPSIWKDLKNGSSELTTETGEKRKPASCDNDLIPDNWYLCERSSTFDSIAKGLISPKRLLGVPQTYETLQYERKKNENEKKPYDTPLNKNVPSLATMLLAGLNVLNKNNNGFFLMLEGGAIDWACHDGNAVRMIEETNEFNKSIAAAIEWVNKYSNWDETIMIVVADHETGYLTGKNISELNFKSEKLELENNGKMNMPGYKFNGKFENKSYSHSNLLVPIYVKGNGSLVFNKYLDEIDMVRGKYIQNNEIGLSIKELINSIDLD